MKAIVTVIGHDKVGIIASVSTLLSSHAVNILDISQTILQDYFSMIMLVDVKNCDVEFDKLQALCAQLGKEIELEVRIQHEDIFNSMHRV